MPWPAVLSAVTAEVVKVATPFTKGAVPIATLVCRKVTDPVGAAPDVGVTVAVKGPASTGWRRTLARATPQEAPEATQQRRNGFSYRLQEQKASSESVEERLPGIAATSAPARRDG